MDKWNRGGKCPPLWKCPLVVSLVAASTSEKRGKGRLPGAPGDSAGGDGCGSQVWAGALAALRDRENR